MADNPRCFIAMPVSTPAAYQEKMPAGADHFRQVLFGIMVPAVEAAGFKAVPPIVEDSEMIQTALIKNLHECEMVLGDLTASNPNVFFELGIRASFNRPFCLVRDQGDDAEFPFDISTFNILPYNSDMMPITVSETIRTLAELLRRAKHQRTNSYWSAVGVKLGFEGSLPDAATNHEATMSTMARLDSFMRESRQRQQVLIDAVLGDHSRHGLVAHLDSGMLLDAASATDLILYYKAQDRADALNIFRNYSVIPNEEPPSLAFNWKATMPKVDRVNFLSELAMLGPILYKTIDNWILLN